MKRDIVTRTIRVWYDCLQSKALFTACKAARAHSRKVPIKTGPHAMLRTLSFTLQAIAMIGLFAMTVPAFAAGPAGAVQLAFHENSQTAALPAGRISLRVIDRVGGPTLKAPITWRIMTYGRDDVGPASQDRRSHRVDGRARAAGRLVHRLRPASGPGTPASDPGDRGQDLQVHPGPKVPQPNTPRRTGGAKRPRPLTGRGLFFSRRLSRRSSAGSGLARGRREIAIS